MAELDKTQREVGVPGDWTYASAPESRDIVHIDDRYGYFVGGKWLEPSETYETIAPRDEEQLAAIGQATAEDVGRAVAAAREAFADGWSPLRTSSTTPAGRTSSSTPSRTGTRGPSASPARSSPGTSRYSCSPGRLHPRSRVATPSSSSRPRPRRSR